MSGISKFPNFREKRQPREVDQNFRNEFCEISVPFDSVPEFPEFLVDHEWKAPCNLICSFMICVMTQLFWLCIFEQDVG